MMEQDNLVEEHYILKQDRDYWKRRCEAAEKYASFRIDMDVSGEYTEKDEFNQYTLWSNWSAIVEERE